MIGGMRLGKSLRLRRIFANGRALIVDCGPLAGDRLGAVRLLARAGADAVVLTPGLLEMVAEELAGLSVILRIDGGLRRAQQLLSVQAALEMGAEAVLVSVEASCREPSEGLDRLGRVTEDARSLGMPVIAEVSGEAWIEVARLVAEFGADVIQARFVPELVSDRHFVRMTGRPFLASLAEDLPAMPGLLEMIYDLMQGAAQGVVLRDRALAEPPALRAIHGLVHQGISAGEALDIMQSL
jgi:DhnA family fructose-bisphosphate aldolase class Ia